MHPTAASAWAPAPGRLVQLDVSGTDWAPSDAPPSYNQRFHLRAFGQDRPAVWMGGVLDVAGPLDLDALHGAVRALVARHEGLRSTFVGAPTEPERVVAGDIRFAEPRWFGNDALATAELVDVARREAVAACRPMGDLPWTVLGIDRPDTSTVLFAMDHSICDAFTVTVVVAELHGLLTGSAPTAPAPASFLQWCASPPPLPEDRAWMHEEWRRYLDAGEGSMPTFPLDLGVAPGETHEQHNVVRLLAGPEETAAMEAAAKEQGAGLFSALLQRFGDALHAIDPEATPRELRLMMPLHQRYTEDLQGTVGWLTNSAPVVVTVGDLAATHASLRQGLKMAKLPWGEALERYPGELRPKRNDMCMVSFMDFRRTAAHAVPGALQISSESPCDDCQWWFSRADDGLWLRVRHPTTERAIRTIEDVVARLV